MAVFFLSKFYRLLVQYVHSLSNILRIILKINCILFILILSLFLQNPQNIHRKDYLIVISSVLMLTHLHSNQSVTIKNLFFFAFLSQLPHDKKDKGTNVWKEARPE